MERTDLNEKRARYQRIEVLVDAIIADTVRHRGTTYVPPGSEAFGRYVVGVGGDVVPLSDVSEIARTCRRYLETGRPFGTWIESGKVYFDYVTFFDDLGRAIRCAREHNQIAIYDLLTEECIYVS